jgi:mRNA-degrading endonuclease toxin of MazEF toxin-antitoxin module
MEPPRQGEVWLVNFIEGWERPAVVVSRNELNRGSLVLVVPCTSQDARDRASYPNHVLVPRGVGGMTKDTVAQAHLVQPAHISWFMRRLGSVDGETLSLVLLSIAWVLDLLVPAEVSGS